MAVENLRHLDLDFVADSLHETWSLPQSPTLSPVMRIEEWARQQPSPREPFSFLLIEGAGARHALTETHLADYTVFCDASNGFNDERMDEARTILRSQIPVAPATTKPLQHP